MIQPGDTAGDNDDADLVLGFEYRFGVARRLQAAVPRLQSRTEILLSELKEG